MYTKVIRGTGFHTPVFGEVEVLKDALFCLEDAGNIAAVLTAEHADYQATLKSSLTVGNLQTLTANQYLLPGFVDLHVHAPQWPQAGIALDVPLYTWLNECTFPLEARYADVDFAQRVYSDLVQQLIHRGTTTALYFGSLHFEASRILAEICGQQGQRGLVGKVVMDNPEQNPDFYRDRTTTTALTETETFIQTIQQMSEQYPQGLYPVVTPRFIPSCTDEALAGLGTLAQKYAVHVQSHCSESDWEHQYVKARFGKTDTEALRDFGLLGRKTVMAHCNFIGDAGAAIFAETGTSIAHCPLSNAYFANSVIPLARYQQMGVSMGLGTDISGGFSPSLYDNIKQAVISSRMLEDGVDSTLPSAERGVVDSRLPLFAALWLATAGGGQALDLPIGLFQSGYAFDAQIVDLSIEGTEINDFGLFAQPEQRLQKLLYTGTQYNIREVWVQGRLVFQR